VDGAGKGAMQNSGVQEWGGTAKCGDFFLSYRMLSGTPTKYGGWSGQFRSSGKETIRWVSKGSVKQDWSFMGEIMQSWYLPNDSP
jgi:hypothetical protein